MLFNKKAAILIGVVFACGFLLFLILLLFMRQSPLTVTSTVPNNNATDVETFSEISIIFSRPLTQNEISSISLRFVPDIQGKAQWESNMELVYTPASPLNPSTKYTATLTYLTRAHVWSFTTILSDKVTIEEQQRLQTEADRDFAQWQENLFTNYPWYENLPLQTDDYFVYFDPEKKEFIGKLYPKSVRQISVQEQIDSYQNEVYLRLEKMGVDTNQYKISWVINEE